MKSFQPTETHKNIKKDLDKILRKYSKNATAQEILAIVSQMTGMVIALQDQRNMTSAQAMQIVMENIKVGNQTVIDNLLKNTSGHT